METLASSCRAISLGLSLHFARAFILCSQVVCSSTWETARASNLFSVQHTRWSFRSCISALEMSYYAVKNGRNPGVYNSWDECRQNTDGYSNASFKRFDTPQQAEGFVSGGSYGGYGGSSTSRPVVHTDGACSNNGRDGASAGIGVYWGPGNQRNVSEGLPGKQTNNRAEITAAAKALTQAKEMGLQKLTVVTDSTHVIKGATEWMDNWKQNGWKTSTGGDVKNRTDFEALDRARSGMDVRWEHVRGHQSSLGNQEADRLAVAGAKRK